MLSGLGQISFTLALAGWLVGWLTLIGVGVDVMVASFWLGVRVVGAQTTYFLHIYI